MKRKAVIILSLFASVLLGWKCLYCNHKESIPQIVSHSDLSKDGMIEVVCTKCGHILHTEMIIKEENYNEKDV